MVNELLESLTASGVRFVRVLWCDNANIIRGKAFHIGVLAEHAEHGIGISLAQQAIPAMYDAVAAGSGLGPVGEVWLVPDWSTVTVLPYAPGHARVLGTMAKDGVPWSCCPRALLQRMIAAAQSMGLEVKAAFENEFYLLRMGSDGFVPADETVFASTLAMDLNREVIDAIATALIDQKFRLSAITQSQDPGQHEISVRYADALQAADQQITFRETVRAVALQHSLRASFLPKIFADKAGSGCHLHLSLWRDGQNLLPDGSGQLSEPAQAFVAGILQHLPALMGLTTPSPNSFRRIRPHYWSGAFRAWGWDNREAAVRIPTNPSPPSPTHIELKTVDGSANPYLALGGAIAAGLDGIRRELHLPEPVAVDPGHLSDAERVARGIDLLPTNLGDAIAHLSHNQTLLDALGNDLACAYLAVRNAEWEAMSELDLSEEVALLLERY